MTTHIEEKVNGPMSKDVNQATQLLRGPVLACLPAPTPFSV